MAKTQVEIDRQAVLAHKKEIDGITPAERNELAALEEKK